MGKGKNPGVGKSFGISFGPPHLAFSSQAQVENRRKRSVIAVSDYFAPVGLRVEKAINALRRF